MFVLVSIINIEMVCFRIKSFHTVQEIDARFEHMYGKVLMSGILCFPFYYFLFYGSSSLLLILIQNEIIR